MWGIVDFIFHVAVHANDDLWVLFYAHETEQLQIEIYGFIDTNAEENLKQNIWTKSTDGFLPLQEIYLPQLEAIG